MAVAVRGEVFLAASNSLLQFGQRTAPTFALTYVRCRWTIWYASSAGYPVAGGLLWEKNVAECLSGVNLFWEKTEK
jgi:hypothetical protein